MLSFKKLICTGLFTFPVVTPFISGSSGQKVGSSRRPHPPAEREVLAGEPLQVMARGAHVWLWVASLAPSRFTPTLTPANRTLGKLGIYFQLGLRFSSSPLGT